MREFKIIGSVVLLLVLVFIGTACDFVSQKEGNTINSKEFECSFEKGIKNSKGPSCLDGLIKKKEIKSEKFLRKLKPRKFRKVLV